MSYDKEFAQLIDYLLGPVPGLTSKPMFGGVCYLVGGNMAFGIYQNNLIVRLGSAERAQREIDSGRALPFDITGKALKGWVMIRKNSLATPRDVRQWLDLGLEFVRSLPPKKGKKKQPGRSKDDTASGK